jgi:phosphate transport system permease protein
MQATERQSVTEIALRGDAVDAGAALTRARALDRLRLGDLAFHWLTRASALGVLVLLGGIIVSLIIGSLPALHAFGLDFLIDERWNPVTEKFGAIAPIYGTLVTSCIAMLIAVPVGLLIAVFLTELCPMWLRRPIGIAVELLAGIPSNCAARSASRWNCSPESRASSTASGACSCSRRFFRTPCSRS